MTLDAWISLALMALFGPPLLFALYLLWKMFLADLRDEITWRGRR
jgi:hypothetical protein